MVMAYMVPLSLASQTTASAQPTPRADRAYIENRGQIGDQHGKPNHDVRFLITRPGLNIQLRNNGFSYDSYVVERCELPADSTERMLSDRSRDRPAEDIAYHFHRVDIDLVGANPKPMITATGASQDYLNYYTHITEQVYGEQGATDVRGYARVTYHDVWPGIDMEWFLDDRERPEYQFVVRPGGDVASIQWHYRGAHRTELMAEAIVMHVQHGPIRETLPRSYVQGTGTSIDVRYRALGDNTYGFALPPANMAMGETLVIDPMPELVWGTYYGGVWQDYANALALASDGDIVMAGSTVSVNAIATAGSHQAAYGGSYDAFLARFTSGGVREWGTYYGGSTRDFAYAVAVATDGNIMIAGSTQSTASIATAGSHQAVYGGGTDDAFLVRFTSGGVREWGTYYGGSTRDAAYGVAVASDGEIIMAGKTFSSESSAIATAGSHEAAYSGSGDAFLARFTAGGVREWGTYYGGSNEDGASDVALAADGDIVIVGSTSSPASIATAGSHQAVHGGGTDDAFLVRFTSGGVREWGTFFGGASDDWAYAVAVASDGDIVVVGLTYSAESIATAGIHQAAFGGNYDAFLARFTSGGVREWGTYYGGEGNDYSGALAVATDGDIVMAGSTSSGTAIATAGSRQALRRGFYDAFLVRFTSGGERLWGTYYGGISYDYADALEVATDGDIVMAGETAESNTVIVTASSHQAVYGGGSYDAFLAVFRDDGSTSVTPDQAPEYVPSIRSVQPNPAAGSVTVVCSGTSAGTIDIVDVQGRIVRSTFIDAGTTSVPISIADLAPGSYQVRFMSNVSSASGTLKASVQALVIVP
jgi:uncharacterized delta-60 repeat protein